MAVDFESFKNDLESLKNQRSLIQAKLDEATRHITELTETLKGMGFNSVEEAKQAYINQCAEAEKQHALVKQLIQEINQVDINIPTRESVIAKLNSLSSGDIVQNNIQQDTVSNIQSVNTVQTVVPETNSVPEASQTDFIQQSIIPPVVEQPVTNTNQDVDLGGLLFANL